MHAAGSGELDFARKVGDSGDRAARKLSQLQNNLLRRQSKLHSSHSRLIRTVFNNDVRAWICEQNAVFRLVTVHRSAEGLKAAVVMR